MLADRDRDLQPPVTDASEADRCTSSIPGDAGRDVLVVEDDPEINQMVGEYVRLAGFEYRSALDGATALNELRRRAPAMIILDLMLPDLDGFSVCRQVKQDRQGKDVPVIFLTALDNDASRAQGRDCGGAAYLTKPFDPDRLIATISQQWKQRRP